MRDQSKSKSVHPSRHHYCRSRDTCVAEKSTYVSVLRAEYSRYSYYGAVLSLGDMKSIVCFYEREGILESETRFFTHLRDVYAA